MIKYFKPGPIVAGGIFLAGIAADGYAAAKDSGYAAYDVIPCSSDDPLIAGLMDG